MFCSEDTAGEKGRREENPLNEILTSLVASSLMDPKMYIRRAWARVMKTMGKGFMKGQMLQRGDGSSGWKPGTVILGFGRGQCVRIQPCCKPFDTME